VQNTPAQQNGRRTEVRFKLTTFYRRNWSTASSQRTRDENGAGSSVSEPTFIPSMEIPMKHCSKCRKEYSDDSLQFCLSDGTRLVSSNDSEKTLPMNMEVMASELEIKFPIEIFRVYCLFGYETDSGRESMLWNDPMAFHHVVRERGRLFENLTSTGSDRRGDFLVVNY
jgi:hypothetical protein